MDTVFSESNRKKAGEAEMTNEDWCKKNCPYNTECSCDGVCNFVLSMLEEQEEREKTICKEICDFIRGSCSTDTDADKEYVCHVVQQVFEKEGR